jgi:hypothetical protein
MNQTAYYAVRDASGTLLGRHLLAWPNGLPEAVSKPMLARWYKDHPTARNELDTDQVSSEKGIYTKTNRYKYLRDCRTGLRQLLRKATKAEIVAMLNELDPS